MGFPRTFKEITAVVSDASHKDISKAFKFIVEKCGEKVDFVGPADFVRRFCSHLGLNNTDMRAAEEMAEAALPKEAANRCARVGSSCMGHLVNEWASKQLCQRCLACC